MDLRKLRENVANFRNTFGQSKQQEIISPLQAGNTLTPALEHHYKVDQAKQDAARLSNQNNTDPFVPQKLEYPEWMSNAPSEKQQNAIKTVRQIQPNFKGTDSDIISLFNKFGDKLLGNVGQIPRIGVSPTPTPQQPEIDPSITQGSTRVAPNVETFINNTVLPITRKYGIPDAVAAGQFAQEGRLGGAGAARNNFFNIGFTDSRANSGDYSAVPKYKTPEEGVEAYAKFVTGQADPSIYANGEDGSKSGKLGRLQLVEIAQEYRNDPIGWLRAIGPMYSSQGHEYAQNIMNTPEFRRYLQY